MPEYLPGMSESELPASTGAYMPEIPGSFMPEGDRYLAHRPSGLSRFVDRLLARRAVPEIAATRWRRVLALLA
jgi:hypothetical protein